MGRGKRGRERGDISNRMISGNDYKWEHERDRAGDDGRRRVYLIKLLFFSYTHSCYVQPLLPSRHGHMNSPCPPTALPYPHIKT